MEPDELTDDLEVETEDEAAEDEQTPEEEASQDANTLTTEQKLAKAEAEAAKYRRLFEKAKKGPTAVAEITPSQTPTSEVDVDERILKANGMSDKLLTELKVIAQLRKVSLIDAQTDDLFVAFKEKTEKDERSKQASLGTSRGSGSQRPRPTLVTPGLSREDHMKLVKGK